MNEKYKPHEYAMEVLNNKKRRMHNKLGILDLEKTIEVLEQLAKPDDDKVIAEVFAVGKVKIMAKTIDGKDHYDISFSSEDIEDSKFDMGEVLAKYVETQVEFLIKKK